MSEILLCRDPKILPGSGILLKPQGICETSKDKTQKYAPGQYFQFEAIVFHCVHINPETKGRKPGCESHQIQTSKGRAMTCYFLCPSLPGPTEQSNHHHTSCTSSAVATQDETVKTSTGTYTHTWEHREVQQPPEHLTCN